MLSQSMARVPSRGHERSGDRSQRDLRAQESVEGRRKGEEEEGRRKGGAEKRGVGRGGRSGEKKETLTPVSPRQQRKRERLSTSQEALVITYSSCV